MEDKIIYIKDFNSLVSYWRNVNAYRNLLYKHDYSFKEKDLDDRYVFYDIEKKKRDDIKTYKFWRN